MSGFLLDTNVLSELTRTQPDPRVTAWLKSIPEEELYVSVLTLGEIRKGIELLPAGKRRAQFEEWLKTALETWFAGRILSVDYAVAERWGHLTAKAKIAGTPIAVIDGLVVATAIEHRLIVATRNTKHFGNTETAPFNPWES